MRAFNIKRNILFCMISTMMVIGLTGCFKGNISVDVGWSGVTKVTVALGMTQQAQSMIASQGENPFQDMKRTMADQAGNIPVGVEVKQWREGDYDWMSAANTFYSLDQVNAVMADKTLFNHFSLTRNRGIFLDEFVLDAELAALGADMPSNEFGIDPTTFINMGFSARLPGTIVESNGFTDMEDPNLLTWNAQGYQKVSIRARSLSPNPINISVMLVAILGLFIFGVYAFGGFDYLFAPKKNPYYVQPGQRALPQSQPVLPQQQPALPSPSQPALKTTNYIVDLGVEDLLNQVNTRMLNSKGEIRKQPTEIALLWKDEQGLQRFIYVKDFGNGGIGINGTNYPATVDNVKAGIMNVLQKQK